MASLIPLFRWHSVLLALFASLQSVHAKPLSGASTPAHSKQHTLGTPTEGTWQLTSLKHEGVHTTTSKTSITLQFKDYQCSGTCGSTSYWCSYRLTADGSIHLGPITYTQQRSLGQVNEEENLFLLLLHVSDSIRIENGVLILCDRSEHNELRFRAPE